MKSKPTKGPAGLRGRIRGAPSAGPNYMLPEPITIYSGGLLQQDATIRDAATPRRIQTEKTSGYIDTIALYTI